MEILTITEGQVTFPEELLRHLKLNPSGEVAVDLLPDGTAKLAAVKKTKSDLEGFFGLLHDPNGPTLTIEEIKKITEDAWAGKR